MSGMPPKADDQKKQPKNKGAKNKNEGEVELPLDDTAKPAKPESNETCDADDGFTFVKDAAMEITADDAGSAESVKEIAEDCYAIFDVPCLALYLTCCDLIDLPLFAVT